MTKATQIEIDAVCATAGYTDEELREFLAQVTLLLRPREEE